MSNENNDYTDAGLHQVLRNFQATTPGVMGCAISSADGYPIASELPNSIKEDRVAALAAAAHWVGQQTTQELVQGPLRRVFLEGEYSDLVVTSAGPESLLSAIVDKDAKYGLVCFQMERAAKELSKITTWQRIDIVDPVPVIAGTEFKKAPDGELNQFAVEG